MLVISRTPASCSNLLFVDVIKVHPFVFTLLYVLRTCNRCLQEKADGFGNEQI